MIVWWLWSILIWFSIFKPTSDSKLQCQINWKSVFLRIWCRFFFLYISVCKIWDLFFLINNTNIFIEYLLNIKSIFFKILINYGDVIVNNIIKVFKVLFASINNGPRTRRRRGKCVPNTLIAISSWIGWWSKSR